MRASLSRSASAQEVVEVFGTSVAPDQTEAMNFAFDVTPASLVRAIITEKGVMRPPYEESLVEAVTGD